MLLRLLKKEKQNLLANNLIIENFSEPHLNEVFSIESNSNPTPWKIDTFKQVLEVRTMSFVIKDESKMMDDDSNQDQTHYQNIEYFDIKQLIQEEVSLNYPNIVRCEEKCLEIKPLKTEEKNFPFEDFKNIGYASYVFGQKSYNGVAILAKNKIQGIEKNFFRDQKNQARTISCDIKLKSNIIKVINIYVPNGNPIDTDKYDLSLIHI